MIMDEDRINTLTITTPEGIDFSLMLAGPVTRFLAWLVDVACIAAISTIAGTFFGLLGIISRDIAMAASIASYFVISIGYGIATEWFWRGQTIGKRIFALRVMDARGLRLQFSQVIIRNLLRFVDSLPLFYMVGGLACLFSTNAQRLGDLAGNTVVVWIPPISEPDLDQLMEDKYNSFDEYPHIEARLRQRVSVKEAGIILEALMRRDCLDPVKRVELFKDIARYFKKVVEFPQNVTDGISDEQYIRNLADVLFREKIKVRDL